MNPSLKNDENSVLHRRDGGWVMFRPGAIMRPGLYWFVENVSENPIRGFVNVAILNQITAVFAFDGGSISLRELVVDESSQMIENGWWIGPIDLPNGLL